MKQFFSEHKKAIVLSTLATLLPAVIGCVLWNLLPNSMVIHWGVDGAADGFGTKAFAVLGVPAILAALNLLCMVLSAFDQKEQNKKAMRMVFWIMPLMSLVICSTIYAVSMGKKVDIGLLMPLLFGVLFLVIGNYMPKVKQNSTLGIKISWTLNNEENWNKTHRLAGKVWAGGGLLMLLSVLLPVTWSIGVLLVCTVVIVATPVIYSYRIYKAHKAQGIVYAAPAKTRGQKIVAMVSTAAVIVILAGVAVLMFTGGVAYTCNEDTLRIEASFAEDITVPYKDMEAVELREDFDIGMRVFGFASARLSSGTFQNEEFPAYTLYAYNACPSMILIRSGEKWLALNAATPEETQKLYETLQQKLG